MALGWGAGEVGAPEETQARLLLPSGGENLHLQIENILRTSRRDR